MRISVVNLGENQQNEQKFGGQFYEFCTVLQISVFFLKIGKILVWFSVGIVENRVIMKFF